MDDLAATEKVRSAERQIAIVRSFVVLTNTLAYLLLMDKAGTFPGLAAAVIAVAFLYSGWVLWRAPYRRYALFLSSYFTAAADALLIVVWVLATGGIHSPFYILLYLSISAAAFRYAARETAAATAIYAGSYLGLLLAPGSGQWTCRRRDGPPVLHRPFRAAVGPDVARGAAPDPVPRRARRAAQSRDGARRARRSSSRGSGGRGLDPLRQQRWRSTRADGYGAAPGIASTSVSRYPHSSCHRPNGIKMSDMFHSQRIGCISN